MSHVSTRERGFGPGGLAARAVRLLALALVWQAAGAPPADARSTAADRIPLGPAEAPAPQEGSWRLTSFHAEIEVFESGQIVVTETLEPRFEGSFNGIYRTIPVEYRTPRGFRYELDLDVESVTDDTGAELRYEEGRDGEYRRIKIWVPDAVNATRTVVIRYRVANGLRFFQADDERDGIVTAYDELYWNVTGSEWPVPIERASATVRLPVDVTGIRAHAFTGAYGSTDSDASVTIEGARVRVETTTTLDFREGLTVGVAWDAGIVHRPTTAEKATSFLMANWPLLLPFVAFFLMYRRWSERGRDPELGSVEPRYEPPDGLTPAEVGVVIDNSADMRDITATVVDLAVRGYLTIEAFEEDRLLGLVSSRDYRFVKQRPEAAWDALEPHERQIMRGLFSTSDSVELSDLKNKFYKHLDDIKAGLSDTLVEHGVYVRRPDSVQGRYVAVALLVGASIAGLGLALGRALRVAPIAVVIAAVLCALVVIAFGIIMPARTRKGVALLRHVKGLEEFLERVESDRFRRMIKGPDQFEKLLPFAMALGVEQEWARAFQDLYTEPPDWYRGSGFRSFNSNVFVSDLGRMSTQTQTVMQSAPRSSGSSSFGGGGFSGGGFSGGGFGGGGGGAF